MRVMKRAGCWCLNMGLESANQSTLDALQKGTTVSQNQEISRLAMDMGFTVMATYMLGVPGETRKDAEKTIEFSRKVGAHITFYFLPVPFPKTRLFNLCAQSGGLRETGVSWDHFTTTDFNNMVYVNPNFTKDELLTLLNQAFKSYYRNPKIIWANLIRLTTPDQFKAYLSIRTALKDLITPDLGTSIRAQPHTRYIKCNISDLML
jgi:hypothetical protein